LPDGVDLSAYRIVQEALSNAMRHATGAAVEVKLYYGDAALVVEVRNDCPPGNGTAEALGEMATEGGGHGIIRMRERATILGAHRRRGVSGGPPLFRWTTSPPRTGRDHPRGDRRRPGDGPVRLFRVAERAARHRGDRGGGERAGGGRARRRVVPGRHPHGRPD